MILVTRLNGTQTVVNADLIEQVECTPDVTITLSTGRRLVVLETLAELRERVMEYRRRAGLPTGGIPSLCKVA